MAGLHVQKYSEVDATYRDPDVFWAQYESFDYEHGETEHAGFSLYNSKHRAHPAHRAEEHARIYATGAGWVNDDEEFHEPPC